MRVLMVEDDPLVSRAASGWLRPAEVVVVTTLAAARMRVAERFRGHVIDHHLPDGRGLGLAIEIRARDARVPILLLTGDDDAALSARCGREWIFWGSKHDMSTKLRKFARACRGGRASSRSGSRLSASAVTRAAVSDLGLEGRMADVLECLMSGRPNREGAEHVGIAVKTYEHHVKRLLSETGARNARELVSRIWRQHAGDHDDEATAG